MTRYRYNKLTHKKEQVQCPYCGPTNIKKIVDKPEGTDYRERLEVKAPYQPPQEYIEPPREKPTSLPGKCFTALVYLGLMYALVWYLGWDQVEGWLEKLVHVITKMLGG